MTVDIGAQGGTGKDTIRRFNLSATLAAVHALGPISRSRLIREVKLGRTTVFELVNQLISLGLLAESDASERVGVGRPSLVVRASERVGAYVVNPESGALTVGVVTFGGQAARRVRRQATPWEPRRRPPRLLK